MLRRSRNPGLSGLKRSESPDSSGLRQSRNLDLLGIRLSRPLGTSHTFTLLPKPPTLPPNLGTIMQNKPNLQSPKNTPSIFFTRSYKRNSPAPRQENKPNSSRQSLLAKPDPALSREVSSITLCQCAFALLCLRPNYAKQTQFPQAKNQHNLLYPKPLRQKNTPPPPEKTNPIYRGRIKPKLPAPLCALAMPGLTLGTLVHFSHFSSLHPRFPIVANKSLTARLDANIVAGSLRVKPIGLGFKRHS